MTRNPTPTLQNGPGLHYLRRGRWYGPGYCGICGHRGAELIPRAVRYWDADDGWKMGVLCSGCTDDVRDRGPQPTDYPVVTKADHASPDLIDVAADLGDLDAAYTDTTQTMIFRFTRWRSSWTGSIG